MVAVTAIAWSGASKPAHAAGTTTLTVWDPVTAAGGINASQQKLWQGMIDTVNQRFEKANPGVKINEKHFNYGDFDAKVPAAVATGTAPDVLYYGTDELWKYTLPLNSMLTAQQKKTIKFLDQSVVSAQDRKLHVLPFGTYEGVWMYNKALFRKYHLAVPTTQAQFLGICDKLNAAGVVPLRATFGGSYTMDRYVALLSGQLIPNIADWNSQKIPYTSPKYKGGVTAFMQMTAHKCWGPNPQSTGVAGEGDQMFRAGKTAIQYVLIGPNVADYEKSIGKGNLGVFLQPALPGGKPSMDASLAYGFSIVKTTKQTALAYKYISFWDQAAQQQLAWSQIQQLPNLTNLTIKSRTPVYSQMLAWAKDPQFHVGAWPVNAQEFKVWDDLTPDVITGRTSVDSLLTQLQAARSSTKP
jgi:ABC-type glycerol-3-phosphate transport system substrate-binding protein